MAVATILVTFIEGTRVVAPLLPGRASAAAQPGPPVIIISATAADDSPAW
jgi:hypothetical protein